MLMVSTLVFSFSTDNVEGATGPVTLVNWDSDATGTFSGAVDLVTLHRMSGVGITCTIVNTVVESDPNSFYVLSGAGSSWINLTNGYNYISSISIALRIYLNANNDNSIYLRFYNNSNIVLILKFFGHDSNHVLQYYGTDSLYHDIIIVPETINKDVWLNISHLTSNQLNYNVTGDLTANVDGTSAFASEWTSFDSIFVSSGAGTDSKLWLDDIIISTTGTGADEGSDEDEIQDYIERDAYKCTGLDRKSIYPFRFDQYEDRYLDIGFFGIVADYRVKAVELYVAEEQILHISNTLTDYDLMINGIPAGSPDYFVKVSYDMYKIRWMTEVTLNNENPIFQFKSSKSHSQSGYSIDDGAYTTLTYNWYLPFLEYDYTPSLFGTGIHNNDALYGNEIVNNPVDFIYVKNGPPVNAIMCFYYDSIVPITPSTRNDYIDTDKAVYSDTDENINIFGTNSDLSGTTLHIYNTDTTDEMTYHGLPYVVSVVDFNYNVKLLLSGNYNTTLERGGLVVADADFTITSNITDYWMATEPNPSDDMDSITLHYMFNHSNASADAKIVLSSSQYLTDTYAYIEQWYKPSVVLDNSYHDITNIVINQEGLYYFIMAVETQVGANIYWTPVNVYEHVVKEKEYENSINILTKEITLGSDGFGFANVQYTHNHLGSNNIYLYLNGIETVSLKDYSFGTHTFKVSKAGYYNVSLVFIEDDGDIVSLDYGLFEAIGKGVPSVTPTPTGLVQ